MGQRSKRCVAATSRISRMGTTPASTPYTVHRGGVVFTRMFERFVRSSTTSGPRPPVENPINPEHLPAWGIFRLNAIAGVNEVVQQGKQARQQEPMRCASSLISCELNSPWRKGGQDEVLRDVKPSVDEKMSAGIDAGVMSDAGVSAYRYTVASTRGVTSGGSALAEMWDQGTIPAADANASRPHQMAISLRWSVI